MWELSVFCKLCAVSKMLCVGATGQNYENPSIFDPCNQERQKFYTGRVNPVEIFNDKKYWRLLSHLQ